MARRRILLVNPPIYDFTAYDFWLRPYGMLRVAGRIQHACDLEVFDFLVSRMTDPRGRGRFPEEVIARPQAFRDIPRRFRRFGRPRDEFCEFLQSRRFDEVLVQTTMTYWYSGLSEVIEDVRRFQPQARIILGGVYATLLPAHAQSLGADLVVRGSELAPLFRLIEIDPVDAPPYWNGSLQQVGVMKLTEGCPFRCTYCAVPLTTPGFTFRPVNECLEEVRNLARLGARNIAFYDDALLFKSGDCLAPFLRSVIAGKMRLVFHTPNALNARFITPEIAGLMVEAGFISFFIGLENRSDEWHRRTGGKLSLEEFSEAMAMLRSAGAKHICAYVLIGHPDSGLDEVEATMRFAHAEGARVQLSEFAPVPGTTDGERCRPWADIEEPLSHNKTAFTIRRLGVQQVNRMKGLCRQLNSQIPRGE
jgi:radical SAM superfamily enzyme YgiQ (UPF0313 family)